jgi:carbon-monoxide dehydrogenase large subunit
MQAHALTGARFIGERLPRKEDSRLLAGRGTFVDDVVVPGMLHAAFLRSPIAHGRIASFDAERARELPGVWDIFTLADFASLGIDLRSGHPVEGMPQRSIPVLADELVTHVGDPVAVVVARSRAIAEDAAAQIAVEYEELPPLVTMSQARSGPPIHPGTENNIADMMALPDDPETERILAEAPHVVTTTINHQRVAHCAMETRGLVAVPQGERELTLHMGVQSPQTTVRFLSEILSLPQTSIRVIAKDVGGSFGLKSRPWREEVAVIAASLRIGRPVKWIEDRFEALTGSNQAREQECTLRTAFDEEGRLLASHAVCAINNGAYPHYPDNNTAAMAFVWAAYKQPRFGFRSEGLYSNTTGLAAYRGPWAMESLVRETQLDIAARQIGIDPVEIRRRNLITADDLPHTTNMQMVLEDVTPSECLDQLLKVVDVAAFRAEQVQARAQGRYLGLGISSYIEPTAVGSFAPMATEVANLRIEPDGKVTAFMGTHSQGQGTPTTMAQVIADRLGVPYEDVTVFEDDSAGRGFGAGSGGSRQAVIGGGAAIRAAVKLGDKVREIAAHLLNASPEAIRIERGMVHVEGAPEMTRSLREIAEVAYGEPGRLPPDVEPGLEVTSRYQPPPITFASAAHACIVEIDADTGFVSIERWVSSEDCGVVINPAIVEGQIAGGLAQAIGTVLLEEIPFDAQGNPLATTFKDYKLPLLTDVPEIEFTHICTPAKGEGGFRGVGEGGNIIGPPTLINAIHDALVPFGVTCLDLPLTPARLLEGIERGRAAVHRGG